MTISFPLSPAHPNSARPTRQVLLRDSFQFLSFNARNAMTADSVHFAGGVKPETLSKASTTKAIDALLDQCDASAKPERMTFSEFLIKTQENPAHYLPTASAYVLNAFDYYEGNQPPKTMDVYGEQLPRFSIMNAPWGQHLANPPRIFGHEAPVKRVWEIIQNFKQQPNPNRVIAFFGPHGSGKSLIPKTIMAGLENYSQQDEGALWTYSFIFPNGKTIQPQAPEEAEQWLKLTSEEKTLKNPDQTAVQLLANLNLNPIFLLPSKQRIAFIQDLQKQGKLKFDLNMDYYLKADLDGYGKKIIHQLQGVYADDPKRFRKIMDHVQVQRFHLSNQEYRGLVEVPSSRNPDAVIRETSGEGGNALPPSLKAIGRRTLDGFLPRAHRGIFYMDDFGRTGQPMEHLLIPFETGEVTMQEQHGGAAITKEQLDFISMLSVNPEVLDKAKRQGNFEALEQRMLFVPVPWERRYQIEAQILAPILKRAQTKGVATTPEILNAFSLWTTMTRLFPINQEATVYKEAAKDNKQLTAALRKLTPLKKALLYQGENIPDLSMEENRVLKEQLKIIANEHQQSLGETEFTLYEGGLGIPTRSAANILKLIVDKPNQQTVSFIDAFEAIATYAQQSPQYEKKRADLLRTRNKTMEFPTGLALLKEVEDHTRNRFMIQLKSALSMHQSPDVYTQRIQHYASAVEALQTGQSLGSSGNGFQEEKQQLDFVESFETTVMGGKRSKFFLEAYRNKFLARAKDWNAAVSDSENLKHIYQDEFVQLQKEDETKNHQYLDEFRSNVKVLLKNPKALENQKDLPARKRLNKALEHLQTIGYTPETLPKILDWALEGRYIADQIKT